MNLLFVYGTLMPGDVRWPLVADQVLAARRSRVRGRLFDTGEGYPGARFDLDGEIEGWILELRPDSLATTLASLDHIEGAVWGLYRRVTVMSSGGDECW
ncbi:MAG: gamma-glutamylcyclotransferase, partial [Acidimicrobiia bacterium]|nr:gamma-glutamylcyclotransferase [Acidimicrobiia bacterium]